jgi:nucleoside phosphorylase
LVELLWAAIVVTGIAGGLDLAHRVVDVRSAQIAIELQLQERAMKVEERQDARDNTRLLMEKEVHVKMMRSIQT